MAPAVLCARSKDRGPVVLVLARGDLVLVFVALAGGLELAVRDAGNRAYYVSGGM
jgi:hypothetical protein